jgi:YesN/AraC family two-component response regulator
MEGIFEDMGLNNLQNPFYCRIQEASHPDFFISAHWHHYMELLYFIEGTAIVYAGEEHFTVKKGDMVLITPDETHSIIRKNKIKLNYYVLQFDPDILNLSRSVFELKYVFPFMYKNMCHRKLYRHNELIISSIPQIIKNLYVEFHNKQYGYELAVQAAIHRIVLWILRIWKNENPLTNHEIKLGKPDMERFIKLLNHINKNYNNNLNAKDAALLCNMSYFYFSRQFKKVMGKSFTEYLTLIRVREAEKLLLTTELNITQIALNTGFCDCSYFIKQFKLIKGTPPNMWKEKARHLCYQI